MAEIFEEQSLEGNNHQKMYSCIRRSEYNKCNHHICLVMFIQSLGKLVLISDIL